MNKRNRLTQISAVLLLSALLVPARVCQAQQDTVDTTAKSIDEADVNQRNADAVSSDQSLVIRLIDKDSMPIEGIKLRLYDGRS